MKDQIYNYIKQQCEYRVNLPLKDVINEFPPSAQVMYHIELLVQEKAIKLSPNPTDTIITLI